MHKLAADTLQRAAGAAGRHLTVKRRVAHGPVVDGVTRHARDADLLVIGSRGYRPLRRLALGPHAGLITHAVTNPVIVLPRHSGEQVDGQVITLGAVGASQEPA